MKTYKNLTIFLILVVLWSAVLGIFKYFLWGVMNNGLHMSLETIAGYISLGGIFAYLFGGALAYTFQIRSLLVTSSILAIIVSIIGMLTDFQSAAIMPMVVIVFGYCYGLWSAMRNMLISVEIERTGLSDTFVTGLVTIAFTVAIIGGSIGGGKVYESFGVSGIYLLMSILVIAGILSVFLSYESYDWKKFFAKGMCSIISEKKVILVRSFREFLPQIRILMSKYLILMMVPAIILTISTILSQKSVAVSVDMFHKAPSEGSMMLLYAAVGAILGNIITLKATAHRWAYFTVGIGFYTLLALAYPFFLGSYTIIIIMTFIAGVLFGVTINLTEGYMFYRFAIDNHKEYGSAVYGIILSAIIVALMFIVDTLQKQVGFVSVFVFLSAVLGISGIAMMYDAKKNWLK